MKKTLAIVVCCVVAIGLSLQGMRADQQCASPKDSGTKCAETPPNNAPTSCVTVNGPLQTDCRGANGENKDITCAPNPHNVGLSWDIKNEFDCESNKDPDSCCRLKTDQPCIYQVYTNTCSESTVNIDCSDNKKLSVKRCNSGAPPTPLIYTRGATYASGCSE